MRNAPGHVWRIAALPFLNGAQREAALHIPATIEPVDEILLRDPEAFAMSANHLAQW